MKATYVEYVDKNKVAIKTEDISADNLGPWEVLVRNETSIISAGTELARLTGIEAGSTYPCRPGYGSIGRIEAKGSAVTDFAIGDRVFYAGKHASLQRFKHGENHQWARLYPAPADMDPVDAAFACLAQIAITAPNLTQLDLGDTVAVFGMGLVGNLAAQMYAIRGAKVIAVDPVGHRCELARKVGIQAVLDCPPAGQVAAIKKLTGDQGAAVTCDAVGHTAVVANCVYATANFGQVLMLGSPRAPYTQDITPVLLDAHCRGITIRGTHMWQFPATDIREHKLTVAWNFRTVFDLIQTGRLNVRALLTHVAKPQDVPAAYEGLQHRQQEYVGVVIDWRGA